MSHFCLAVDRQCSAQFSPANDKLVHRCAKLASRMQQHGICVVCGDRVFVELSPYRLSLQLARTMARNWHVFTSTWRVLTRNSFSHRLSTVRHRFGPAETSRPRQFVCTRPRVGILQRAGGGDRWPFICEWLSVSVFAFTKIWNATHDRVKNAALHKLRTEHATDSKNAVFRIARHMQRSREPLVACNRFRQLNQKK